MKEIDDQPIETFEEDDSKLGLISNDSIIEAEILSGPLNNLNQP